ncbi:hypothetical protein [Amnibacterium endophyticum]|uniref:Glutaminase n=1 Tax=Amnibacterium endophyticum TaxID=2109337 RepID=A0ABW4LJQ6_9MICO
MDDEAAAEAAVLAFRATAERLAAEGAPDEALARFEPARRRFGVMRAARLRPLGRVWRLGVLLLHPDGAVRATGATVRSAPPGHARYAALSVEARREVRAAAFRGPFAPGETIDYDAPPIELTPTGIRASGPLLIADGGVKVRWSVSAPEDAARDLAPYLAERVELLLHPPDGT